MDVVAMTAEALASVTGMWPRRPPDMSTLLAAEGMQERWEGRLRRWLKGEQKPLPWRDPPARQEELQRRITASLNVDEVQSWLMGLGDPEVGVAYAAVLQQGRALLQGMWPSVMVGSVLPEVLPLSVDEYAEVWSVVRVLDDPDTVLDEMDAWTLTTTQARAFRTVYPTLSAALSASLDAALADHVYRGRALTWQQEDVVRVLRGLDPEAAIELPAPPQPAADVPQPSGVRWGIDFRATRTPSERTLGAD